MSENGHYGVRDRSPLRSGDRSGRSSRKDAGSRKSNVSINKAPVNRRVYVSNFPYESKWQDLKDLFVEEIGDVTFVQVFKDEKGRSRGCGIVEFSSESAARDSIDKMHGHKINGRELVVKEDTDKERDKHGFIITGRSESLNRLRSADERRGISLDALRKEDPASKFGNTYGLNVQFLESLGINGPLVSRVFVANLDYKVDKKKLKEIFKLAGKIVDIEVYMDNDGNSRGFATIEFEHPVEAVQAISMFKDQVLFERKMAVRMDSTAMREEKEGVRNKLPFGLKGIGMGLGANGAPLKNVSSNISSGGGSVGGGATTTATPTLSNLVGASALASSGLGGLGALSTLSTLGGLGGLGSTGLGVSNLQSNLQTSLALQSDARRLGSGLGSGGGGGGAVTSGGSSTRADTIIVRNIPNHFTFNNLRESFMDIGDIVYSEIRDKGVGIVRFSSEKDAIRAVNLLDRTRLDGNVIDVFLY